MELPSFEGLKVNSLEYKRVANRRFYLRNKEAEKVRSKAWRKANPEKYAAYVEKNRTRIQANSRRHEYKITEEQFQQKMVEQDNKCAICGKPLVRPVVDHNHSCCSQRKTCGNCNRGILCQGCNTIIGLAQDSVEVLSSAIQYLKGYQK
jgi:hypothetical protein